MNTSYNEYIIRILSMNTNGKSNLENIAEWQFLFYKYGYLHFQPEIESQYQCNF